MSVQVQDFVSNCFYRLFQHLCTHYEVSMYYIKMYFMYNSPKVYSKFLDGRLHTAGSKIQTRSNEGSK